MGPTDNAAVPAVASSIPQHLQMTPLDALIERASRDTSIDIERMKELILLRNQERDEARRQAFYQDLSAAQSEMRTIGVDKDNSQTRSKYASYDTIYRKLKPIYTKHHFALTFNTEESGKDGTVKIICEVTHNAGHIKEYSIEMPSDGKGAKGGDVMTKTHATGAAITYGKRYLLNMIFNVSTGDEDDDDGNLTGQDLSPINAEQAKELTALIEASVGTKRFLEVMNLEKIGNLPARDFEKVKKSLENKKKEASAAAA